ncbi:MAG: hypothetical protein ACRDJU_08085, partial [Actinomycetota bacterium]
KQVMGPAFPSNSFVVPGLSSDKGVEVFEATFEKWRHLNIGGGFLWTFPTSNPGAWSAAIQGALG